MAKNKSRRDDDELEESDFEVVEEEPKPRRKSRVRDDGEDERPRRRDEQDDDDRPSRRNDRDDEEDERPRRRDERDEDDYEQPRRKKKRKKKSGVGRGDRSSIPVGEWVTCLVMIGFGLILCFASAIGIAGKGEAFKALATMLLAVAITIPVTIGVLMGVGMALSIDYGEWKAAIMKLAAISILNNGLLWLGQWIGLPFIVLAPLIGFIGLGMFMTLFDLDTWETGMSVVAINVVQFVARVILIHLALAAARHEERKKDKELDDAPIVRPNDNGKMPMEDDDDPPGP